MHSYVSVPLDWGTTSCYVKIREVIRNYALRSWAGPLGSGSISPDQQSRTRFPLGTGPVSPRVPEKGTLTQTAGGPGPPTGSRTPQRGGKQTPRLRGSGAATCPQTQACAQPRSFLGKTRPPTMFNAGDVKYALPLQSPR